MDRIVCVLCDALTDDWVVWGAAYVEDVYYFCSNGCLARWLVGRPGTSAQRKPRHNYRYTSAEIN